MTILNTSFFFTPDAAQGVRIALRTQWLPVCQSCGVAEPVCLQMPSEQNVERLAIQTPFNTRTDAERFLAEVLTPLAGELSRTFGSEIFSCFSTIMEVITL